MESKNQDSSNDDFDDEVKPHDLLDYCHHCGILETKSGEFQTDELDDVYCPKCFPKHAVTVELINVSLQGWKSVLDGPWIDVANAWHLARDRIDKHRAELDRQYDRICEAIKNFVGKQYVRKVDLWMFIHRLEDAIGELKYGNVWAQKELEYIHRQLDETIRNLQEMSKGGKDPDEKPNETDL